MKNRSTPVEKLTNIGPTIARRLKEIGIGTDADLRSVGAVVAYQRICAMNPGTTIPVCYYLYSLDGALRDKRWDALGPRIKQELLLQAAGDQRKPQSRRRVKLAAKRETRTVGEPIQRSRRNR